MPHGANSSAGAKAGPTAAGDAGGFRLRALAIADLPSDPGVADRLRDILEELQLPQAVDLTLYIPHAFHTFTEEYAAGLYTYLWSDVIAADIAESFLAAPGGLYDQAVAERYMSIILAPANTVHAAQAFREFKGRDPDPGALMRRFGLVAGGAADR